MTVEIVLPAPAAVLTEVKRLAAEHPARQVDCVYANERGRPVCIVGCALYNLGVPPRALKVLNVHGNGTRNTIDDVYADFPVQGRSHPSTVAKLAKIQVRQDEHETWGEAVRGIR